ncbi:MAG: bifunctional DNA-formamidopyrimidine glycosylase/DNA-(apurinic or apyrimidinic site) lyase [Acidibrevibacterium sp.]|uniref:bifunctional DNA-formamidopyrimidine glycosylase/DNA-(apurinic or apyrimidinic site) lyase n=1 Tax=Acidibrevibacterium sp. TaxID=2606776 RepID=UPI003D079A2E
MPELPEVETVMRAMAGRLLGQVIARAELRRADLRRPVPPDLVAALTGARVSGFRRRAKYILMRLAGGQSVLWHLGMSGRILLMPPGANVPEPAHCHLLLMTEAGFRLGFIDPRRFGLVDLVASGAEDAHPLLAGLGPEPLEEGFTPARLAASLAGRQSPIKSVLLDQRVVAGLGNIYVAEALFRAGLHPARLAGDISRAGTTRLVAAIRETLTEAIAAGGSSLRDYVQPDGELGYFQHAWRVYGRAGAPCPVCPGAPRCAGVARFVQAGRSSFYCPRRQR